MGFFFAFDDISIRYRTQTEKKWEYPHFTIPFFSPKSCVIVFWEVQCCRFTDNLRNMFNPQYWKDNQVYISSWRILRKNEWHASLQKIFIYQKIMIHLLIGRMKLNQNWILSYLYRTHCKRNYIEWNLFLITCALW